MTTDCQRFLYHHRQRQSVGRPVLVLRRCITQHAADPDSKAAKRANYLVQHGLTRKAAQVLHSTAQMADLRTAASREAMIRLHPRPPPHTTLPVLPRSAPACVLEDDADIRRLLSQSDCMRLVCQIIEITDPTAF